MPHGGSFFEITAILGLATLLGIVGQQLIIMFLAAGHSGRLLIGGARKVDALKPKAPL